MKAVVLDVRGGKSVVLMRDGTVKTVRGRYAVGEEVHIDTRKAGGAKRLVAAAAAVAVLVAGGLWYDQNMVACAEVSIDLNPSIVYTVNKRSRVLSVRAENDDAADVVASLVSQNVRGGTLAEALEKTVATLQADGYIAQGQQNYVLVGIATDSQAALTALEGQVETALSDDDGLTYAVSSSDSATARAAREAGVSPGRYSAWQEVTDSDDTALQDFRSMDVRDIIQPLEGPQMGQEPPQGVPEESMSQAEPPQNAMDMPAGESDMPGQNAPMGAGEPPEAMPDDSRNAPMQQDMPGAPDEPPMDGVPQPDSPPQMGSMDGAGLPPP